MTTGQITWTVLIAAQAVVNLPFILNLLRQGNPMTVPAEILTALAEIDTSIAAIPTAVAAQVTAAESAATAQTAQDNADTLAAVQARATALKAAVGS